MATVISNILTTKEDKDLQIDSGLAFGGVHCSLANYVAAGALADNTVILMCEVPVNAKIIGADISVDDLGTAGTMNIGFYPGNIKASDVVIGDALDEDALATAIDVNAAALLETNGRFEVADIKNAYKKVWELAGLSAEPGYAHMYIGITLAQATTAGGDIMMKILWSQ